jgi:hypothetical protein
MKVHPCTHAPAPAGPAAAPALPPPPSATSPPPPAGARRVCMRRERECVSVCVSGVYPGSCRPAGFPLRASRTHRLSPPEPPRSVKSTISDDFHTFHHRNIVQLPCSYHAGTTGEAPTAAVAARPSEARVVPLERERHAERVHGQFSDLDLCTHTHTRTHTHDTREGVGFVCACGGPDKVCSV